MYDILYIFSPHKLFLFEYAEKMVKYRERFLCTGTPAFILATFMFWMPDMWRSWKVMLGIVNMPYSFPQKAEDQWQVKLQMVISTEICIGSLETLRLTFNIFSFSLSFFPSKWLKLKIIGVTNLWSKVVVSFCITLKQVSHGNVATQLQARQTRNRVTSHLKN